MIGVDPHKASHTAVVISAAEEPNPQPASLRLHSALTLACQ
jgi:hypothetical protein